MYSVTGRVKMVKQPYGGYLKSTDFKMTKFDDHVELNYNENMHPSIIGMTVDYLSRFMMGSKLEEVFKVSIAGAKFANELGLIDSIDEAFVKLISITGLDDKSIISACHMSSYDAYYRDIYLEKPRYLIPNAETIENIRIMVNRCMHFWELNGPILLDGFTFEGAYTKIISSGDGDFLTKNCLWDLKVSKNQINKSKNRLQLLVYYIMGCRSVHEEFRNIEHLGLYNPRLNCMYKMNIADIDKSIISDVSKYVIGY